MTFLLAQLLLVAFFLNLLYEMLHSVLYTTCLEMPLKKYVPLMLKASIIDAIWITGFYLVTYFIFKNKNPFTNYYQLVTFSIISLAWAYFWEMHSIKSKRWEYATTMPLVLGVGLTPLVQLFLTGIISFYTIFVFF